MDKHAHAATKPVLPGVPAQGDWAGQAPGHLTSPDIPASVCPLNTASDVWTCARWQMHCGRGTVKGKCLLQAQPRACKTEASHLCFLKEINLNLRKCSKGFTYMPSIILTTAALTSAKKVNCYLSLVLVFAIMWTIIHLQSAAFSFTMGAANRKTSAEISRWKAGSKIFTGSRWSRASCSGLGMRICADIRAIVYCHKATS